MTRWPAISNNALVVTDVPARGSSWHDIGRFASTFNAYEHYEEVWEHSDWSQGIPIEEYQEAVRRRSRPHKAFEVSQEVRARHELQGAWVGTLTELRAFVFIYWRAWHDEPGGPPDLSELYDVLDVIRMKVVQGETE